MEPLLIETYSDSNHQIDSKSKTADISITYCVR